MAPSSAGGAEKQGGGGAAENGGGGGEEIRQQQQAQELCAALLAQINLVQAFKGRWMVISARLRHISDILLQPLHPHHQHKTAASIATLLPQIISSLQEATEHAQRSIDLSYGGKLLMQSKLDAMATKLDIHIRDLEAVQWKLKQQQTAKAIRLEKGGGDGGDESGVDSDASGKGRSSCDHAHRIPDLFVKLRIGSSDVKRASMEALIQYLKQGRETAAAAAQVAAISAADMARLIHLLDSSSLATREKSAELVAALAMTGACCQTLAEAAALPPLIRAIESGTPAAKEKAALAVMAMTRRSPDMAHSVAAQDGAIAALVKLCGGGGGGGRVPATPAAASYAAGTLRNLAENEHLRKHLADAGAVEALVGLLGFSPSGGDPGVRQHAAEALHSLTSGKDGRIRSRVAQCGGIERLVAVLKQATTAGPQSCCAGGAAPLEAAISALLNLAAGSSSAATSKALAAAGFVSELGSLVRHGAPAVQSLAASALAALSTSGDMRKHQQQQESAAAAAAAALWMGGGGRRKEMVTTRGEERGLTRLVQMLDPRSGGTARRLPMSALLALYGGGGASRKRIAAAAPPQVVAANGGGGGVDDGGGGGGKKALEKLGSKKLLGIFTRSSKG